MSNGFHWYSIHLYYEPPFDHLLKHCISPLFSYLLAENLCQRAFFVRYSKNGPHLRIRLGCCNNSGLNIDEIIDELNGYIRKYPSHQYRPENLRKEPLIDNPRCQQDIYMPELSRYGGPQAIAIAERQFMLSSLTVLGAIHEIPEDKLSYEQTLGLALRLHLGFLYSLGFSLLSAVEFLNCYKKQWLSYSIQRKESDIENSFQEQFNEQKSELLEFHQVVWQYLNTDSSNFAENWFNHWLLQMRDIKKSLVDLMTAGQLKPVSNVYYNYSGSTPEQRESQSLWPIYDSYMHMTNNRLGVANHDESYIAYIMAHCLASLEQSGV